MGTIENAARSGSRLDSLIELRNTLAARLDKCQSDRDLAALSRQFVSVTAEIEMIEGNKESRTVSLDDFRNKIRAVK